MVDLAQVPVVDQPLGRFGLLAVQRAQLDRQLESLRLSRLVHGHGIGERAGHRLFTVHVLARFQRRHGHRHVKVVVQADVHRLNVVPCQQVAKVGTHTGNVIHLGDPLRLRLVDIGDRYDLCRVDLAVPFQVVLADLPYPNHTDLDLVHAICSFVSCGVPTPSNDLTHSPPQTSVRTASAGPIPVEIRTETVATQSILIRHVADSNVDNGHKTRFTSCFVVKTRLCGQNQSAFGRNKPDSPRFQTVLSRFLCCYVDPPAYPNVSATLLAVLSCTMSNPR